MVPNRSTVSTYPLLGRQWLLSMVYQRLREFAPEIRPNMTVFF